MPRNTPPLVRCFCLLLTLGWLAGCAIQPAVEISGKPDLALQEQLTAATRWQFSGKLAVRTAEQSESAQVLWLQDGNHFDIHLSGPAGLKATHIYGTQGDANFEQGDRLASADSVEALSEQLVGWPLPATELTWWLRGLPATNARSRSVSYTTEGWLSYLAQDGWAIHFSNQQRVGHLVLPGRIEATRGEVKIILVIKEWQVP